MIKVLFIVGQCIRLLNQDPWQSPTLEILEIGDYTYNTRERYRSAFKVYGGYYTIKFKDQKKYKIVKCPGE